MWLVVYLGNVGKQYSETRHNYGFMAADALTSGWTESKQFSCAIDPYCVVSCGRGDGSTERFIAIKPNTLMNRSGDAVRAVQQYYKIPVERTVVVHDDIGLALGKVKVKQGGGAGGHNGLKSIDPGGTGYFRVRCGIGPLHAGPPVSGGGLVEHVLGKFTPDELHTVNGCTTLINGAVTELIINGLQKAQEFLSKESNHETP